MLAHAALGARIALRADLVPQLLGSVAARRPALTQVRLIGRQHGPARPPMWGTFGEVAGAKEAAHRLAPHAELAGDVARPDPLLVQGDDLLIAGQPPRTPRLPVLPGTGKSLRTNHPP